MNPFPRYLVFQKDTVQWGRFTYDPPLIQSPSNFLAWFSFNGDIVINTNRYVVSRITKLSETPCVIRIVSHSFSMAVGERRRVKHGDGFTGGGRGGLRYISVYICEIIHCPTRWTPATTFRREHVFCCCRPRGVNIHCEFLLYYFIYIYMHFFFIIIIRYIGISRSLSVYT